MGLKGLLIISEGNQMQDPCIMQVGPILTLTETSVCILVLWPELLVIGSSYF